MGGSRRRVIPLSVETAPAHDPAEPTALLPPRHSPLHGGGLGHRMGPISAMTSGSSGGLGLGGMDRLMLMRNVTAAVSLDASQPAAAFAHEVSAAHNHKERKRLEALRRREVVLMTQEDYTGTEEGEARLRRRFERARMQEQELEMRRLMEQERAQRREEQLARQREEEALVRAQYLAQRQREKEDQEQLARAKEEARQQALETKMKQLKEAADAKARAAFAAKQRQLREEAMAEHDARVAAVELAEMAVEDALAHAMRQDLLVERERQRQLQAEAEEWKRFEEEQAQRQREETAKRRAAQAQQYEREREHRMQMHKLQKERADVAAEAQKELVRRQNPSAMSGATNSTGTSEFMAMSTVVVKAEEVATGRQETQPLASVALSTEPPPPLPPGVVRQSSRMAETDGTADGLLRKKADPQDGTDSTSATDEKEIVETSLPRSGKPTTATDAVVTTEPFTIASQEEPKEDAVKPLTTALPVVAPAPDGSMNAIEPSVPVVDTKNEMTPPPATAADTPLVAAGQQDPDPSAVEECVETPCTLAAIVQTNDGIKPCATVLTIAKGSPAMTATLLPGDLVMKFGDVTSARPQCLLAIAECVQASVNKCIELIILHAADHDGPHEADGSTSLELKLFHTRIVHLTPRKWKGKGLLGCQLGPFKWPVEEAVDVVNPEKAARSADCERANEAQSSETSGWNILVIYGVQESTVAHRLGLQDGDLLVQCGDLKEMTDMTAVATYLQSQWREARLEIVLALQRWLPQEQYYQDIRVTLPQAPLTMEEPLGCSLTSFAQYYYPSSNSTNTVACPECSGTSLVSVSHAAALYGHNACLSAELLDVRDGDGRSPLFYACYAGHVPCVQAILTLLANSDFAQYDSLYGCDSYGDSPLHAAVASDAVEVARVLLQSGYVDNVELKNQAERTSVHLVRSVAMLRLLHEEFHADLLHVDADGRMPLFYVCLYGDEKAEDSGRDAEERIRCVSYLCQQHPEFVDYADSNGNTPLHIASWCGQLSIVRILVSHVPSISLYMPNAEGYNPLTLAQLGGWKSVAQFLETCMVDDGEGITTN